MITRISYLLCTNYWAIIVLYIGAGNMSPPQISAFVYRFPRFLNWVFNLFSLLPPYLNNCCSFFIMPIGYYHFINCQNIRMLKLIFQLKKKICLYLRSIITKMVLYRYYIVYYGNWDDDLIVNQNSIGLYWGECVMCDFLNTFCILPYRYLRDYVWPLVEWIL